MNGKNSFIDYIILSEKIKKDLINNYDYIEWLYRFTEVYRSFSTNSWLYQKNALNQTDLENVKLLPLFFSAVCEYYNNNLFPLYSNGFTSAISIKYKEVFFEIWILVGQETRTFIKREKYCSLPIFVDFEDIVNKVEAKDYKLKLEKLNTLKALMTDMKTLNVPFNFIKEIMDSYTQN
ncbi:MAG: hypothetical protein IKV94_05125 [Clostridia bacterium]|nr:hypothetical protein [Clostridia bacterium]